MQGMLSKPAQLGGYTKLWQHLVILTSLFLYQALFLEWKWDQDPFQTTAPVYVCELHVMN